LHASERKMELKKKQKILQCYSYVQHHMKMCKKPCTPGCTLLRDMCTPTKKYCSCSILEVICKLRKDEILDKNSIPVAHMWEKDAIDPRKK
jgi:hypothetical protein